MSEWKYPTVTLELETGLAFRLLEVLRLNYIYVLKDSHPEELGEDFKRDKWDGYEIQHAEDSYKAYKAVQDAMRKALDAQESETL